MSTAYACTISVCMHIHDLTDLNEEERNILNQRFLRQWDCNYSPVHSLAFRCNPFFDFLRNHVEKSSLNSFIYIEGDIIVSCHDAINILRDDLKHDILITDQFIDFYVRPRNRLSTLSDWHAILVWGQLLAHYSVLARVMYNVFLAPASTASVERSQKMNKRVCSYLCT